MTKGEIKDVFLLVIVQTQKPKSFTTQRQRRRLSVEM
jgi:hypothetical protein